MNIICIDRKAVSEVRAALSRLGIIPLQYNESGPFLLEDGTFRIVLSFTPSAEIEAAIRREIGRISGATISD
jgi:hypothetical protein